MGYKYVTDTVYKGFDVTIYEHADETATCDIKNQDGELINGNTHFSNFLSAAMWAGKVIDGLEG